MSAASAAWFTWMNEKDTMFGQADGVAQRWTRRHAVHAPTREWKRLSRIFIAELRRQTLSFLSFSTVFADAAKLPRVFSFGTVVADLELTVVFFCIAYAVLSLLASAASGQYLKRLMMSQRHTLLIECRIVWTTEKILLQSIQLLVQRVSLFENWTPLLFTPLPPGPPLPPPPHQNFSSLCSIGYRQTGNLCRQFCHRCCRFPLRHSPRWRSPCCPHWRQSRPFGHCQK